MGMINTMQERLRIPVVLIAAISLIALAGCGTEAPGNSTVTVTAFGVPVLSNMTITASATKTQNYRVYVADSEGNPLNDIDVNFFGQFTNGEAILFGGATGTAPITLSTTEKTDNWGFFLFKVTAPYYAIKPIHVPYNQTAVALATGGTLSNGTYSYTVTASDFIGETEATALVSAVVTNITPTATDGSVTVSWAAVPGATSYTVYGRVAGSEGALIILLNPTGDPLTWVDTGSNTPTAAPCYTPIVCNTTGLSLNTVVGTAQATSGVALSTFNINF